MKLGLQQVSWRADEKTNAPRQKLQTRGKQKDPKKVRRIDRAKREYESSRLVLQVRSRWARGLFGFSESSIGRGWRDSRQSRYGGCGFRGKHGCERGFFSDRRGRREANRQRDCRSYGRLLQGARLAYALKFLVAAVSHGDPNRARWSPAAPRSDGWRKSRSRCRTVSEALDKARRQELNMPLGLTRPCVGARRAVLFEVDRL